MDPAIARWLHSNLMPPFNCGTLKDPKDVGQSGMESPASLLVTSAPATIKIKVAHAVNSAKLWCARLYGVARDFSFASKLSRAGILPAVPEGVSPSEGGATARTGETPVLHLLNATAP